jgi:hypothetical protein
MKQPDTLPDNLTVKLLIVVLRNANVKYCAPDLPVARSGPAGRYPELRSVVKWLIVPNLEIASLVPATVTAPDHA